MIPVYGFLEGDTIGLLVLAEENAPVSEIAEQLQRSARIRVAHRSAVEVWHRDRVLDAHWTTDQCGIKALDRIDVRAARER